MRRIFIFIGIIIVFSTQAQTTKKIYVWVETEAPTVFVEPTQNWKPQVPYKHFVRLISEVIEVSDDYYVREQFYEYLMTNYINDFRKMKLHKDFVRIGIADYNTFDPYAEKEYRSLFEPISRSSWQYESILIKGFKYNPSQKTPGPMFEKARLLLVEGKE